MIKRRDRIFLGCEGGSELSYAAFLQDLADDAGLHINIVRKILQPAAGDPYKLAEKAVSIHDKECDEKAPCIAQAVMLDADRLEELQDNGRHVIGLLEKGGFITIWQEPDHEGLLLRHFPGHERDNPPRGYSMAALQRLWPEYRKKMNAKKLSDQFDLSHVRRAAGVNDGLMKLLQLIGLAGQDA